MLQRAFENFYREAKLLEHYRSLNKNALVRLIHKYERVRQIDTDFEDKMLSKFCPDSDLDTVIAQAETILTTGLFKENKERVRKLVSWLFRAHKQRRDLIQYDQNMTERFLCLDYCPVQQ
jgi:hypothetical protein